MARSHPPTLITIARRTLVEECRIEAGAGVLVGVSGGPDSMALLHVLSRLARPLGFSLFAHGVDHGLRSEARGELDLAERVAASLGVAFGRSELAVAPGGNLQARARRARLAALERAAEASGARYLATAHHADDRAETVLLRLLRGGSPRSLGVLPARDGTRLRPLVRARRSDVALHLARHALPFAEDPSNQDARFLRTRVRHELLPLLAELSPGIVGHLVALADELASGPASSWLLPDGEELRPGRAQRAALRRLLARPRSGERVRVRGARDLELDPVSGRLRLAGPSPRDSRRVSAR